MAGWKQLSTYTFEQGDYSPDEAFALTWYGEIASNGYYTEIDATYVPTNVFVMDVPFIPADVPPIEGDIVATLDDAIATVSGEYDSNVTRFIVGKTVAVQEDTQPTLIVRTKGLRDEATFVEHKSLNPIQDASSLGVKHSSPVDQTLEVEIVTASKQSQASPVIGELCVFNQQATYTENGWCGVNGETTRVFDYIYSQVQQMTKVYPDKWLSEVEDSAKTRHTYLVEKLVRPFPYVPEPLNIVAYVRPPTYVPTNVFTFEATTAGEYPDPYEVNGNTYSFNSGTNYAPGDDFKFKLNTYGAFPTGNAIGITSTAYCAGRTDAQWHELGYCVPLEDGMSPPRGVNQWIDLPPVEPPPDPPTGSTITVPTQDTYTMQNVITCTLDDDLTAIELENVNLNLDADSTAWTFNATLLDPDQIDLVKQLPDGSSIKLHITINTNVWHVLVEKISTTRSFAGKRISISGRGISALLNAPYEKPVSVNFGSLQTVQQIAESILIPGWTITWSAATWNIDAGAYSYANKTPLAAISDLCKDIGAMVVPSTDSNDLAIMPRYPVDPWNFDAVGVDVAIPEAAILEMTEEPTATYLGDAVYIHGGEIGGELSLCRLNSNKGGTGAKTLPTISNNLMTDAAGIRSLGRRVLAAQYAQPKVKSITTFMDEVTVPFVNVGTYIGITVDAVEHKGIVNAVAIAANRTTVEQTLTIGESTPNTWMMFTELLPQDPLLVATMTSTDGTTSLMMLVDGGVLRVRGTGTPTQKYYIRSGEIVSDAPNVTTLSDTVIPV